VKRAATFAPWIFIIIWSSGFVVAKYGFESADSLYFLAIRLILATFILFALTLFLKQPIRISRSDFNASVLIGLSLHGLYLAGVWYAIELRAPAGLSSVVTSLQPVLVSLLAIGLLGEKLRKIQGVGLVLGIVGVIFVVLPTLSVSDGFTAESLAFLIMALLGSTVATLLQKKVGHSIPLMIGTTIQFGAAAIVLLIVSCALGRTRFELTPTSFWSMAWAVLVTSIAAVLLLLWLLNRGTAAKVSSLLYLVPPMAVLQALVLFGEKVNAQAIIGIVMTSLGVALVLRS
jgi:drug/metabolite transporter (DMT)-like permease